MIFEILTPIGAELLSLTNRSEKHGEEDVPAISIWFELEAPATILDMLGDGLIRHAIYYGDEKQKDISGLPKTTPHLRSKRIARVNVEQQALEGWRLTIDHGIDENDPVAFGSCKVDGFSFEPKDHQIVKLKFRVGTSDINQTSLGIIGMNVGRKVTLCSLTAPKVKPKDLPTDKGAPLFEGIEPAPARKPGAAEKAAVANVKGAVKYRDKATGETWSGRGLQPKWLKVALNRGAKLSDFEVAAPHKLSPAEAKAAAEAAFKPTLSTEAAWPFPKDPPKEAPPQSVTTTRHPPQSRTARGREATKAALAKGQP